MSSKYIYSLANLNKNLSSIFGIDYVNLPDSYLEILPPIPNSHKYVVRNVCYTEDYVRTLLLSYKEIRISLYPNTGKKKFQEAISTLQTTIDTLDEHLIALLRAYEKSSDQKYISYIREFRKIKKLLMKSIT
jgi:hypothetical protein